MDFVEQLKSSVDIVSVVGEYVRLRRSGPHRHMGLCPFHNEKRPSFTVHAVHQFYKCFSCGAKGDVLNFVMEMEHVSFYEALKLLSERYGIPMPKRSEYSDAETRARAAVYQMQELAQESFRANLSSPAGAEARGYLERRGVSPETAEQFGLGYSAPGGGALARLFEQRGLPPEQMEQSGLVSRRPDGSFYDRFRNRLMFPIHNESGKIIGFGGRALAAGDEPKYLNSPETPVYKKSFVLYNLHRAKEAIRKEDRVILVEGYMDVIGVTAAGFRPVVASCGTSLTAQQAQALKRHTPKIVVNFDPDAPGANAAERSINLLLEEGMRVSVMERFGYSGWDRSLDPDEYCKEHGRAAYASRLESASGSQPRKWTPEQLAKAYGDRLESATGYFHWLADRARTKYNVHTSEGIAGALQFLLPAIQRISDRLERAAVANDLAGYIGVDPGLVLDSFRKAVTERRETPLAPPKTVLRHEEWILLSSLLSDAETRAEIIPQLRAMEALEGFPSRRIFQTIFTISDAGGKIAFEDVNARLEEQDQELLASAALATDSAASREEVLAWVASMRLSEQQRLRARLKSRVKEAERAGNLAEALQLAEELQKIERASERA